MKGWRRTLIFDPLPPLVQAENAAINYFARRDLLGDAVPSVKSLGELNEAKKLLQTQKDDGSWRYRGVRSTRWRSGENYDQLETYRVVGQLIEKFGMTRYHSAVRRAAGTISPLETGLSFGVDKPQYAGGWEDSVCLFFVFFN